MVFSQTFLEKNLNLETLLGYKLIKLHLIKEALQFYILYSEVHFEFSFYSNAFSSFQPLNDSHPNAAGEAFFAAVVDPPECPIKWMHNDQEINENDRRKFGRDGGFCTMKEILKIMAFRCRANLLTGQMLAGQWHQLKWIQSIKLKLQMSKFKYVNFSLKFMASTSPQI